MYKLISKYLVIPTAHKKCKDNSQKCIHGQLTYVTINDEQIL